MDSTTINETPTTPAPQRVAHGYKQTEVGVIPVDWEVDSLGCFWSVIDWKHVTAQFVDNSYPIASIKEVQSRFVDLANAKQTTTQYYNLLIEGGRKPKIGDLILSRNATVGEMAQVTEKHPPFAMGQDVCLLRKKTSDLSTNYLQMVFRSPISANQLLDLMVGSTFKRINVQQIRNFIVPMPPPPEQTAIAEALSDADALIEIRSAALADIDLPLPPSVEEQTAIAAILSDMDSAIAALEAQVSKAWQVKQGMLQALLTGRIRLG